jgi:hypothetical protein
MRSVVTPPYREAGQGHTRQDPRDCAPAALAALAAGRDDLRSQLAAVKDELARERRAASISRKIIAELSPAQPSFPAPNPGPLTKPRSGCAFTVSALPHARRDTEGIRMSTTRTTGTATRKESE